MRLDNQEYNFNFIKTGENIIRCSKVEEAFFNIFNITLDEQISFIKPAEKYIDGCPIVRLNVEYGGILYEDVEFRVVAANGDEPCVFLDEYTLDNGCIFEPAKPKVATIEEQIELLSETVDVSVEIDERMQPEVNWSSIKQQSRQINENKIAGLIKQIEQQLSNRIDDSLYAARQSILAEYINIQNNAQNAIGSKLESTSNKLNESISQWEHAAEAKISSYIIDAIDEARNAIESQFEVLVQEQQQDSLAQKLTEHVEVVIASVSNKIIEETKTLHQEHLQNVRQCVDQVLSEQITTLQPATEVIVTEARGTQKNLFKDTISNIKTEMSSEMKAHVANLQQDLYKKFAIYAQSYAGGGSVAVQFADGGNMNGTLNVSTGQILSGGIDLLNIFSTTGASGYQTLAFNANTAALTIAPNGNTISLSALSGASTGGGAGIDTGVRALTANWQSTYTTVNANSGSWNYQGTDIKSLTGNWQNTYTSFNAQSANNASVYATVNASSAAWIQTITFNESNAQLTISNGNTISLSALSGTSSNSGTGIDTGVRALTANWQSTYTTVNANSGSWNYQGTDIRGLTANWQNTYTNFSAQSANNISVYTTVNANSGSWNYQGTDIKSLTANWQNTYTAVNASSATWIQTIAFNESNAQLTISNGNTISLSALSGTSIDAGVRALTANWQNTYTTVNANSSNWQNTYTNFLAQSASNLSVYSTVNTNSATNWNYQGTDIKALTGNWQSTYSTVNSYSATWNVDSKFFPLTGGKLNGNIGINNDPLYFNIDSANIGNSYGNFGIGSSNNIIINPNENVILTETIGNVGIGTMTPTTKLDVNGVITVTGGNSNQWNSVYSSVNTNSATNWNYQGTDIKALTGNWQNTYSTVSSFSATWGRQTLSFNASNAQLTISDGNTVSLSALSGGNGSSGVSYLSALKDVYIPSPANGQVLTYSSVLQKWTTGSPTSASNQTGYYGSFYDTTAQTLTGANQAKRLSIADTFEANGVSLSSNKIVFNNIGTYEIIFSIQYKNTSATQEDIYVWFRKNGVDVSDSSSVFTIPARKSAGIPAQLIAVTPFIATLAANDFIEIYWHCNATEVTVETFTTHTNPTIPDTPGVIVTVKQVTNVQLVPTVGAYLPLSGGTVTGVLSTTNVIYANGGNSDQWNNSYTTVNSNSATNWNYQGTDIKSLTGNWQNTYTNFSTQSANNLNVYTTVNTNSASWVNTNDTRLVAFAADAGSTDAYAATLSPAPSAYTTGAHYRFKANTANTGAATINFNSLGAKTIVKAAGGITTTLADNDIRVGQWVDLVYDGTNMQMQSTLGNAATSDPIPLISAIWS